MSLSGAAWEAFARSGNVQETWLVRLYYDAEGATDFITLGERDGTFTGIGNAIGAILGTLSIRRSIDIAKSSAKISNLSIELANVLYHGLPLSDELIPGATRKYINRTVAVYSMMNGVPTAAIQVGSFRLRDVSWDADSIRLDCEPNQPWDFISIPNVQASDANYFPVVYGDFTPNDSKPSSLDYCPSVDFWPAKVVAVNNDGLHCLLPQSYATSAIRAHIYEEAADQFIPLVEADGDYLDASHAITGGNEAVVYPSLEHGWKLKPRDHSSHAAYTIGLTDPEKSYDDSDSDDNLTYGYAAVTGTAATIYYSLPQPLLDIWDSDAGAVQFDIEVRYYWDRSAAPYGFLDLVATGMTTKTLTITSTPVAATQTWTITNTDLSGGILPAQFGLQIRGGSALYPITARIYDVRILIKCTTGSGWTAGAAIDPPRLKDQTERIEQIYFAGDGLGASGGFQAAVAADIHEAHRDAMYRFAGYTGTPTGWSDLDTARSGWSIRWWALEPVELAKVLDQMQYEGGFIFTWSATGGGRYIFRKSSYSSGDVAGTIAEDIDTGTISWSHTGFDELLTKQEIKYGRDAADESRFRSSLTQTNSTARSNWKIQTLENVAQIELEMLAASVDEFGDYYEGIFGDLKRIGQCDILNPRYFVLEIGDVIKVTPKRGSDSRYYMITDERRSPGKLGITFREVG